MKERIKRGAILGATVGGLIAGVFILPAVLIGADEALLGFFVYLGGSVAAGCIAGMLAPVAVSHWLAAGPMGFLSLLPLTSGIMIVESGWPQASSDIESAIVVAGVIGVPVGYVLRLAYRWIDPFGDFQKSAR